MGKRWRRRRQRTWRQVFTGEGCIALTDELIATLVTEGWDRDELLAWQASGAVYSKPRRTILSGVGELV